MPDSVQVFPPGFRLTDTNGDPVSGAKINFYDAGTTDAQTVYSDSGLATALPNPVICDSAGAPTSDGNSVAEIYVGTSAYKVVITDSSDVTLFTFDDIQGAVDTSSFSSGSGTFNTAVNSESSDFSITSGYYGDLTSCNPTGATFTATLPSAVTAGDGTRIGLRHDGTANEVKIATVSSQTIKTASGSTTTAGYTLRSKGHSVWFVSDGAGWTIDIENLPIGHGVISITDRLTAPPSSPSGGARYILNGTGTGEWASYSEHDVLEADGQGGWILHTPADGWFAYVVDENLYSSFQDTAWVDQVGMAAAQSTSLPSITVEYHQSDGTEGGAAAATDTWTKYPFSREVANSITGASMSSSVVTLPEGNYLAVGSVFVNSTDESKLRLQRTDSAATAVSIALIVDANAANNDRTHIPLFGTFNVAADDQTYELQYHVRSTGGTSGLGVATISTGEDEIYGRLMLIKIDAPQGATGAAGPQGATGATGPAGAAGATGTAGQTIVDYTFDSASTTDADPGSGIWRADNATPASVTEFYVDDLDRLGVDQSSEIATWDDSTSTGTKAKLYLEDLTSNNRWTYNLTGVTANSGYLTLAVTHSAGTDAFASNNLNVVMVPRGDKGSDGAGTGDVVGPASSVDSEMALFDSTTGKLIKRASLTGIVKAASGVASAATAGTDYLAPPSGTAVQKANSGGALANAAATDLGAGTHTLFVPAGAMVPRTTNGAAEGDSELATNDIMLRTLDFDTTTEEGAGFFIAMPKSWDESTVTFIPYWTAGSGSGGVVWGLAGYAFSDNDALDTAVSGQQTSTDTFITANDCHVGPTSSAITLGGTPAEGDIVYFEVTREVGDGSDTLAVDALLIGIKLLITTDAITDA